MTRLRGSLVGRMLLWAAFLFALSLPVLWSLFSAAVVQISEQVVDTQIREQAIQLRGYWASAAVSGGRAEGPALSARVFDEVDADSVWQISVGGRPAYRSAFLRLLGESIPPRETAPGQSFVLETRETPIGRLRIAERLVRESLPTLTGDGSAAAPQTTLVHYLVGLRQDRYADLVEEHAARLRGLALVVAGPVALILFAFLAGLVLILRRNLTRVDTAMARFEDGASAHIEGNFPAELQALVDRMNGLIDHNRRLVDRTRKYVTKIAHDINHPLAVLRNGLDGGGRDLMERQIERMRGLIDRYTSLARAIGPEGAHGPPVALAPLIADLRDGLSIVYRPQSLRIDVDCPADLTYPAAQQDLEAIFGNLAGNAHKFAASHMVLSAADDGDAVVLAVDDDGPGIPADRREAVFNWGKRLDEAPPGTGFGLSIVRDIVQMYDGSVTLSDSPLGGLRATVRLPRRRPVGRS